MLGLRSRFDRKPSAASTALFATLVSLLAACDGGGTGGSAGQGGSAGSGGQGGGAGQAGQGGAGASAGSGGTAGSGGQAGGGQGGQGGAGEGCGNGTLDPGEQCDDGNTASGDGCEADCTKPGPEPVVCSNLAPLPSGTCEVTPGDGKKLLTGDVLVPGTVYVGGQVLVDAQGFVTCAGCDCSAGAADATEIVCPGAAISPAFVNAHDHITFIQNDPYTDTGERYEHRHDWRKGNNGHTSIPASGGASADNMSWGELRFVMGGATSTVGSGSVNGLLRNLDKTAQEGLGQAAALYDTFPLGDSSGTELTMGCGYPSYTTAAEIAAEDAYFPHVAEGIEASARNELLCLSGSAAGGQDLMEPQSAFIHSVGLLAGDYALMGAEGTALVWSPRSNVTLYGDTAVVTAASRLGVTIALGTDWMPTGSMNMLRELACADSLNSAYYDGFFTDEELWEMATLNGAIASATDDVLGSLTPGKVADIAIFAGSGASLHRAVIEAEPQDVALVLRAGKVLYGDASIVSAVPNAGTCDALDVCGTPKSVCLQGDIGKSLAQLTAANQGKYALFHCGAPPNEPSCLPSRIQQPGLPNPSVNGSTLYDGVATADDADGDGIADANDNCPTVFNPIRPVDDGAQADFDGDGAGDACDVCPIDANTPVCSTIDPNDLDNDGAPNLSDNCPDVANANQADADGDGKGDACDACPMAANPGAAACPATIYDVKDGTIPAGSQVAISGALVTARKATGYFMQVKETDAGYQGPEFSGVFVYAPGNTVAVGDRVTLTTATVGDFFGQTQLTQPVAMVTSSGEAGPAPIPVDSAEVATGGLSAGPLEGVLVEVADATVTNLDPTPGAGQMAPNNEFEVDGTLRVNDFFYTVAPYPAVGDTLASVRGVLRFANANSKLEPRDAGDVVFGSATLAAFGPTPAFVRVGQSGVVTIPAPLEVKLSSPLAADAFVTVTSGDPAALTVMGGGVTIPAGQLSAPVLVSGLAQAASVTLTATYAAASQQAAVRVLGASEVPTTVTLTPDATVLGPLGSATFTLTLDLPAPAAGSLVALSVAPASAATVPASVTVPANQLAATFVVTDLGTSTSYTASAALGASVDSAAISVVAAGGVILNEVDYDNVGADGAEYVELYNPTAAPIDLSTYEIVLVNGSDKSVYSTIPLDVMGTLGPGQYLVVGSTSVAAAAGAIKLDFVGAQTDRVQNGAPDAVAIIDTATMTLVDALSYEGDIGTVMLAIGAFDLLEGAMSPAAADNNMTEISVCRLPNGVDTDVASADWKTCSKTPGAPNLP
jgi:cysteine-rich repeat protein